ncbi:MAG TPA: hypothetical protein DD381_11875 [Lentisphaeria bacterium]|nr:MAG: hypothetical protein A2X47_02560 [Lentisphaerae bacterium GWF2_38_69]HBM17024.1 hypothetical protein [Lentisphaeria bacterium]
MKIIIVILSVLISSSALIADVQNVDNATQSMPSDPTQTTQQLQPVENLQNIVPDEVNTHNQALMEALNDDPMIKTSPVARSPNVNTLSGQVESNIVYADGANFDNMSNQVDKDISSANNVIYSQNDKNMTEAAKISTDMGISDVNNLSIPQVNTSTGEASK